MTMNRDRTPKAVRCLAMAAVLGLGATAAHAQQATGRGGMVQGRPAAAPRAYAPAPSARNFTPSYTYRPGYYGYGYYPAATATAPAATAAPVRTTRFAVPTAADTDVRNPGRRDWTRGWDLHLAKPWLRPTR
jgi:hypothetical protein